jgi:hypothetical protein
MIGGRVAVELIADCRCGVAEMRRTSPQSSRRGTNSLKCASEMVIGRVEIMIDCLEMAIGRAGASVLFSQQRVSQHRAF